MLSIKGKINLLHVMCDTHMLGEAELSLVRWHSVCFLFLWQVGAFGSFLGYCNRLGGLFEGWDMSVIGYAKSRDYF